MLRGTVCGGDGVQRQVGLRENFCQVQKHSGELGGERFYREKVGSFCVCVCAFVSVCFLYCSRS